MTSNADRLADRLQPLMTFAAGYEMFAYLVFSRWDRLRNLFQQPDPIVALESSREPAELKLHLGGRVSPLRSDEDALRVAAFVEALRAVPQDAAAAPLYACLSFDLSDDDTKYRYVLNLPVERLRVNVDRKRERVVFHIDAARPNQPAG